MAQMSLKQKQKKAKKNKITGTIYLLFQMLEQNWLRRQIHQTEKEKQTGA